MLASASDAVTDYWFDTLQRPVLRVIKAIANTASRRISETSGMRVIATEDRDYVSGRWPSEIWEMTAEEWRSRCGTLGREVCIRVGQRVIAGRAESLDSEGALLVRTQHGHLERVLGGDVEVG